MIILDAKSVEKRWAFLRVRSSNCSACGATPIGQHTGRARMGEKGAKQIIQQYGTIENAIAHADEIFAKALSREPQEQRRPYPASRELVTIACEMPITLDLSTLIYESADRRPRLRVILRLEFAQLAANSRRGRHHESRCNRGDTRVRKSRLLDGSRPAMISIVLLNRSGRKIALGSQSPNARAGCSGLPCP